MTNHLTFARRMLVLILALPLAACLPGSDDEATLTGEQAGLSLTITSPISMSQMDTTDASVNLGGTASAEDGILQVSWANDRGGEGIATGKDSWQTANIGLQLGENTITVTAEDTAGATTSKSIVVNRESGESGAATLSWEAPTSRVDGSPLTNLAGYRIVYGRMPGVYDYEIEIDNPGVTTYVVDGLVSGDWYFALAAYDSDGLVSDPSTEVLREIS
jgi:hypothetical protein